MFGFQKFQITTELWCLVVWSAQGLDYYFMVTSDTRREIKPETLIDYDSDGEEGTTIGSRNDIVLI